MNTLKSDDNNVPREKSFPEVYTDNNSLSMGTLEKEAE